MNKALLRRELGPPYAAGVPSGLGERLRCWLWSGVTGACLVVTTWAMAAENKATLSLAVQPESGRLEISYGAQTLLVYVFAQSQFKPYVKELYTLKGDNVLRDAPADHLHHHGLMYAIRINGINFWEEANQSGCQKHIKLLGQKTAFSPTGVPEAVSFSHLIHWVAGQDKALADTTPAALLVEHRTLTLSVDEARKEVALRWQADFEVGQAADRVKLHGSGYNGLGLRLPQAFDQVAQHQNSAQLPYSTEGKWDVTPAQWSCVSHAIDGRDIAVALFGSPANKGETRFFTMIQPFTYLAATQNLEKAPIEYARGDHFSLDYLLTAYTERKAVKFLHQRFEQWEKEKNLK